jgi:hypothetical protein
MPPRTPSSYRPLLHSDSFSSALAVFLAVFGMTVEEAQEAFAKLYSNVAGDEESTSAGRAERLEKGLKELMGSEKYKIPLDAKLSEVSLGGTCKVYVSLCGAIPGSYSQQGCLLYPRSQHGPLLHV